MAVGRPRPAPPPSAAGRRPPSGVTAVSPSVRPARDPGDRPPITPQVLLHAHAATCCPARATTEHLHRAMPSPAGSAAEFLYDDGHGAVRRSTCSSPSPRTASTARSRPCKVGDRRPRDLHACCPDGVAPGGLRRARSTPRAMRRTTPTEWSIDPASAPTASRSRWPSGTHRRRRTRADPGRAAADGRRADRFVAVRSGPPRRSAAERTTLADLFVPDETDEIAAAETSAAGARREPSGVRRAQGGPGRP